MKSSKTKAPTASALKPGETSLYGDHGFIRFTKDGMTVYSAPKPAANDPLDRAELASLWRRTVLSAIRAGKDGWAAIQAADDTVKAYRLLLTEVPASAPKKAARRR